MDRASVCDEFINPRYATVNETPGYENVNCLGPDRGKGDAWDNDFDGAGGIIAGAAVGYAPSAGWLRRFRVELEYLYRNSDYDETSDVPGAGGVQGQRLTDEVLIAADRIGSLMSHSWLLNVYRDFPRGRFTPYVGLGFGTSAVELEYSGIWARNPDPGMIATGTGLPNEDEIKRNLAGTTSVGRARLEDNLRIIQAMVGLDYALTDATSIGVKLRHARVDAFRDGGSRSWQPSGGGSPPRTAGPRPAPRYPLSRRTRTQPEGQAHARQRLLSGPS